MEELMRDFAVAMEDQNGYAVAATLTPAAPPDGAGRLYALRRSVDQYNIRAVLEDEFETIPHGIITSEEEEVAWIDVFEAYYDTVCEVLATEEAENAGTPLDYSPWVNVYDSWKRFTNQLIRGYKSNQIEAWTIPCLYVAAKYLRKFAIKADEQLRVNGDTMILSSSYDDDIMEEADENQKLQDAARQINEIFFTAISDRYSAESRMWATYHVANILFSVYFKLNRINLAKNLLRSVQQTPDLPELEAFPKSDRVTFHYYTGVIHFMGDDLASAESSFNEAWRLCDKRAQNHCEIILSHLIPCHIAAKGEVPSKAILAKYPRLEQLFGPLVAAIKRSDLVAFDAALQAGYRGFVKRRIYLAVSMARIIVERNIFRSVVLKGEGQTGANSQPRTRVPITEFAVAYRKSAQDDSVVDEEVEWQIANLINKGLIKGYISREKNMVVLNKYGAFPGTGA